MKIKLLRPILIETDEYLEDYPFLGLENNKLSIYTENNQSNFNVIPQKLILISLDNEDKIDIRDDYYSSTINRIFNAYSDSLVKSSNESINCHKVIATQSQISAEYIRKFIEEYNTGNIKDVDIEMVDNNPNKQELLYHNEHREYFFEDIVNGEIKTVYLKYKPKLTNGFITIVQYPIGGYAPGFYSCKCVNCKKDFIGDKRAVQCKECAITMIIDNNIETELERGIVINKIEPILYTEAEMFQYMIEFSTHVFICAATNKDAMGVAEWFENNKKK